MLVYNKHNLFVNNFSQFFSQFSIKKTALNFLPSLLFGIIEAKSITLSDIADKLLYIYQDINVSSIERRISRFLNNKSFDIHDIFDSIVFDVLSRFKLSHPSDKIIISLDHMFVKEKHTVLMFSLKIGRQGIPIYFKLFPGKGQKGHGNAFKSKSLTDGVKYCHDLIRKFFPDTEIVFLADRWFGNLFSFMNYINDTLHDTFVFRCKSNMRVFYFDPKEGHKIWVNILDLPHFAHKSNLFYNLEFTHYKYVYNLAYCKSVDHKEAWLIITNSDPSKAKMLYGYRFGSIEFIFKSQKTNGFYMEETKVLDLHAFENLYSIICIANIFLSCLGTEISKNINCYKNLGFKITKRNSKTNNVYRIKSRFNSGLRLFHIALAKKSYVRVPFTFTLYHA